jgi:hypothetical protein
MKKSVKKLMLTRETVTKLSQAELENAAGGIISTDNIWCMQTRTRTGATDYC